MDQQKHSDSTQSSGSNSGGTHVKLSATQLHAPSQENQNWIWGAFFIFLLVLISGIIIYVSNSHTDNAVKNLESEYIKRIEKKMKNELDSVMKKLLKLAEISEEELDLIFGQSDKIENLTSTKNVSQNLKLKACVLKIESCMPSLKIVESMKEQFDVVFKELSIHNNYFLGGFLVAIVGVIILAYKSLISRQADRTGHPDERVVEPVGQRANLLTPLIDTIIERLRRRGIGKGTLIISFHFSTQQFHRNVLFAVSAHFESSFLQVLIQNTGNLMNVEPQKLVIIFVDFNDRNIILENEETEIGDLRNQTTKVFMALGCDVFVVYCKDRGSRNLNQDVLYNATLTSIDRHPVLSELKNKNRVLSINDKFHPYQVKHLKNCFQQM